MSTVPTEVRRGVRSIGTGVTVVSHLLWVLGMDIGPTEPGLPKNCFKVRIFVRYNPSWQGRDSSRPVKPLVTLVQMSGRRERGKLVPSTPSPFYSKAHDQRPCNEATHN